MSTEMNRGKAAGLDELTIEYLVHTHPVLFVILAKLFNIIMSAGYVPYGFRDLAIQFLFQVRCCK